MRHSTSPLLAPAPLRWLFTDPRSAWLWLLARLYLAYVWLSSGLEKLSDPHGAWVGAQTGSAITKFLQGALQKAQGDNPDVQAWYASFIREAALPAAPVLSYLITYGELAVGLALLLGLFTGLAAFFAGFMNLNYLLAGTISTNPLLLVLAAAVLVAWRVAGWWGADGWAHRRRQEGHTEHLRNPRRT